MYKLLIVDDEYVEIEALEYVIKNSSLPIGFIKVANNGREAIKTAATFHPDFVLMDIKMPGISGTEAAAVIKESAPDCKIVFLSAYNYFNYAKEAIQLKASDFLIKPVDDRELIDVLNRLIIEQKNESLNKELTVEIESKFKQISTFFENELINYLLFSDVKKEQIEEYLRALNCTPSNLNILIMVLDISTINDFSSLQETMIKSRSLKRLKENISIFSTECFGHFNKNFIYILTSSKKPLSYEQAQVALSKTTHYIKTNYSIGSRAIISKSFSDVMLINPTLLQHKHELLNDEKAETIIFPSITVNSGNGFSNAKEQQLLESIILCNRTQCLSLSNDYTQWLKSQNLDFIEIKYHLYGMLSYIIKSVNCDDNTRGLLTNLILRYTKKTESVTNGNTLYSCFTDQLISVSQLLEQSEFIYNSSVIQTLCRYIDTHYQDDITLTSLCDEVHMNSQYISKLFKEVKGITYSDYLTDTRIIQAKKLLSRSNQTIQEISSLVGYNDPNYFTRAFKKHESISPKAYRQKSYIYNDFT